MTRVPGTDFLTCEDFSRLQHFITESGHSIQSIIDGSSKGQSSRGALSSFNPEKPLDYKSFCSFITAYLGDSFPKSIRDKLFMSFTRRQSIPVDISSRDLSKSSSRFLKTSNTSDLSSLSKRSRFYSFGGSAILGKLQGLSIHGSPNTSTLTSNIFKDSISNSTSHPSLRIRHQDASTKGSNTPRSTYDNVTTGDTQFSIFENDTIDLKDLLCYLSLLESGRPEDKLEFMFRLYDTDGNGVLDKCELNCIVNQMMNVANYLKWDTTELRPILINMMNELDYDNDGDVTLEEWKLGGMTNIPLLVLLGLDVSVKDDGQHAWSLKHFTRAVSCSYCCKVLVGFGRQGLCCVFCKYIVHERCVGNVTTGCIQTYSKCRKDDQIMEHHWIDTSYPARCAKCHKTIKTGNKVGVHCRWCKRTFHKNCSNSKDVNCDFGDLAEHILPPTTIIPKVLERLPTTTSKGSIQKRKSSQGERKDLLSKFSEKSDESGRISPSPASPIINIEHTSSLQVIAPRGSKPLLVFVNPKSGGKQGVSILHKFQYILNPRQVYDLVKDGGPQKGLQFFKDIYLFRILVCGGDGTVGWLLEAMDKLEWGTFRPPVAVLPLGTGNDLARCLRWGGGYEGENLEKIIPKISSGDVILLDRWSITFSPLLTRTRRISSEQKPKSSTSSCSGGIEVSKIEEGDVFEDCDISDDVPCNIFNNYFSIGVDASIAHRFHTMREKHPERFCSRMRNRMFYVEVGTTEALTATCKNLNDFVEIECDGTLIDLKKKGLVLEGISILNITSVYGGKNLWGNTAASIKARKSLSSRRVGLKYSRSIHEETTSSAGGDVNVCAIQDMGDELLELVGLENAIHAGMVAGGLRNSGKKLAQCSQITIRTFKRFPMQIDGEPWLQGPCTIQICHKNKVPMIRAPLARKTGFLSFLKK